MRPNRAIAVLALMAALTPAPARSQSDDGAAELSLWRAIQGSKDPADYRGYLLLFPNGRFAPLARVRAGGKLQDDDTNTLYRLEVAPSTALQGQQVQLRCIGFPAPALFDWIVVLPAGAPDFDPGSRDPGQPQPIFARLAPTVDCAGAGVSLPPLTPGAYEARYISRAFNPDGRSEVVARVGYFVR